MNDAPDWLRVLRIERHVAGSPSLRELGNRCGLSASTLSDVLTGKSFPQAATLHALMDAIRVDEAVRESIVASYDEDVAHQARRGPAGATQPSLDAQLIADAINNLAEAVRSLAPSTEMVSQLKSLLLPSSTERKIWGDG